MKKIIIVLLSSLGFLNVKAQLPGFQWAKQITGNQYSFGYAIGADSLNNIYTVGNFSGTADFDPGSGTYNLTSAGGWDVFVSKMDPSGNLIWAIGIGGTGDDNAYVIKTDKSNNVYIGGTFTGIVDFDPGSGISNLNSQNNNSFILKLNSNGNFWWAKQLCGYNFSIDNHYNIISSKQFSGTFDADPGPGIYNLNGGSNSSIGISKIDSSGNLVWANVYATSSNGFSATLNSIMTDKYDNVYSAGNFQGTYDFDPGAAVFNLTCSGSTKDLFISKIDANGNFVWARQFITTSTFNNISSVAVDKQCNIYSTGHFTGSTDFDPGANTYTLSSPGGIDSQIFVSKLDSTGNFLWAKSLGGSSLDVGLSVLADEVENVYTTGYFKGPSDFDPDAGVFNLNSSAADIFVSKLNASGGFVWAIGMGGSGSDYGYSNTLDKYGNLYTTGWFMDYVDFDPGATTFYLNSPNFYNAYVHKMSQQQVGVKENTKTDYLTLYPDPTHGILNIRSSLPTHEVLKLKVYTILGSLLIEQAIDTQTGSVDLSLLPSGVYCIAILNDNGLVKTQKIIKQ